MRIYHLACLLFKVCLFGHKAINQNLKLGFDKEEYIELIQIYSRWGDSTFYAGIAGPKRTREPIDGP